jgi:hypothetical protein
MEGFCSGKADSRDSAMRNHYMESMSKAADRIAMKLENRSVRSFFAQPPPGLS